MKCLILGDLHLGRSLSLGKPAELGKLNSRIQDQIDLLDWAYNKCVQDSELNNIILTGDIYQDYRPHPAIISIFMQWLKKCEHAGVTVHVIMGNHDILRSGQWVTSAIDLIPALEMQQAQVYKKITRVDIGDFTFVFVPFIDKRMYEAADTEEGLSKLKTDLDSICQESTDKIKIAIGHLALEGSLSIGDEIVDSLNELYVSPDMFSWFDYVWMGHIHHPQIIQQQNPYAAHVGSLDRSDFSKTEVMHDKVAILLDSNNSNKFSELIIPGRPLRPVQIDIPAGKDSTEFVINELCVLSKKLEFKNSIVRLDIHLNSPNLENVDREKIESYLINNLEVFHICGFLEMRTISDIEIDPNDVFDNTMELTQTINRWADTREFDSDEERELFRTYAHEIRQEYEEKYPK